MVNGCITDTDGADDGSSLGTTRLSVTDVVGWMVNEADDGS